MSDTPLLNAVGGYHCRLARDPKGMIPAEIDAEIEALETELCEVAEGINLRLEQLGHEHRWNLERVTADEFNREMAESVERGRKDMPANVAKLKAKIRRERLRIVPTEETKP